MFQSIQVHLHYMIRELGYEILPCFLDYGARLTTSRSLFVCLFF